MITKIRHTGINIHKDELEEMKKFYVNLGFDVFYEGTERYPMFGYIDVVKMKTKSGEILELVGEDVLYQNEGSHLALEVNDLDDVYLQLHKSVYFMFPPMLSNDGTAKVAFCQDPCNFMVELVEIL